MNAWIFNLTNVAALTAIVAGAAAKWDWQTAAMIGGGIAIAANFATLYFIRR